MRTRSRDETTKVKDCVQYHWNAQGVASEPYTWCQGGLNGRVKSITDVSTPGYSKRRARGEIILNDLTIQTDSAGHTDNGLIDFTRSNWGRVRIEGDIGMAVEMQVGSYPLVIDDLEGQVLRQAYANAKSVPVLGGEILATFGQTISMLKRPFKSAISLLSETQRRRNWRLARKGFNATRATAEAWLETRYGWKPLISDACEIMLLAQEARRRSVELHVARGSLSASKSLVENFDVYPVNLGGAYRAIGTKERTITVRANSGVIFRLRPAELDEVVLRRLGLHGDSFLPTLWELTPWSFVVDWFVDCGTWIEAISPRSDIEFLGNWVTTVTDTTYSLSGGELSRYFSTTPKTTYYGTWNPVLHESNTVRRQVNLSVGQQTPSWKTNGLSWKQQVDAAALSVGQINRSLRRFRH